MKLRFVFFMAMVVAAVCLLSPQKASAHSVASITGVVTDQTGASLPHVNVALQN
jgi:hypothetical protein